MVSFLTLLFSKTLLCFSLLFVDCLIAVRAVPNLGNIVRALFFTNEMTNSVKTLKGDFFAGLVAIINI